MITFTSEVLLNSLFTNYIQIPYDEEMTVAGAYDYIKTLDSFKNSKDI